MSADLTAQLREVPLLQSLSDGEIDTLVEQTKISEYLKGEIIIEEGSVSRDLYFLLKGRAKISNLSPSGREIGLSFIEHGNYFGDFSVLDQKPRSASIECISTVTVATLPYPASFELLSNHPGIRQQLMVDHIAIIRQQDERLMELTDFDTPRRIYNLLLKLIHVHPRFQCEPVIHPLPTHHDIAIMTSTSRESVSRVLSQLQQDEITEKSGRYLFIKRIDKLKVLANSTDESDDRRVIPDRRKTVDRRCG